MRRAALAAILGASLLAVAAAARPLPAGAGPTRLRAAPSSASALTPAKPPLWAYYYIWFDPSSWNRAKNDVPLAGPYSSDDANVMRQQIEEAKRAGISGFIVSWKSTRTLDRRLQQLIGIAGQEHFSLGMIYEGLDFYKRPLPTEQVASDFRLFAQRYAPQRPFQTLSKPLTMLSGSWKYSVGDIRAITAPVRGTMFVLATERNVKGYERVASVVDGDAYYWSSVNPSTFPGYQRKLDMMGLAVHRHDGVWVAPAAAGFDARALGGHTVVDRANGLTLLRECAAAYRATPDLVGLISWNEFSERSYIEPSRLYGSRYLDTAKFCAPGAAPAVTGGDVGDSSAPSRGPKTGLVVGPGILGLATLATGVAIWRRRGSRRPSRS
jgi:hypothetical protein